MMNVIKAVLSVFYYLGLLPCKMRLGCFDRSEPKICSMFAKSYQIYGFVG